MKERFSPYFERVRRLPVFVMLGVQGSGTNLLRRILVAAFGFAVVQDQSIVFNAASDLPPDAGPELIHRQFERILARLQPSPFARRTRRVIKSNADYRGIRQQFDPATVRSAADLARLVYAYGAYSLQTDLMAIKSDDLWGRIDQIDRVIPNRRIILLTRDFRDNLLSVTKKDFGPVDALVAAQYVQERFARYEAAFLRTPVEHRYHVRYEDLLDAPHEFVAGFGTQFGVPLRPDGRAAVERLGIRRGNVKKWAYLTPATLAACEGILRKELNGYGYGTGLAAQSPTAATMALARARDVVQRVPQKVLKVSRRLTSRRLWAKPAHPRTPSALGSLPINVRVLGSGSD